jgi:hypothetical protein
MGGSKGGGTTYVQPKDNSMEIMAMMQRQQEAAAAAAREAQRQAAIQAQNQANQQMANQSQQAIGQYLSQQNQLQKGQDLAATQAASASALGAGGSATGGGFDINQSKQQALSNLGAASGGLTPTAANQVGGGGSTMNPALAGQAATINQTAQANQFAMPSMAGITFGGS